MLLSPQLKRNKPWLLIWSGHVKAQFLNIFEEGTAQWTLRRAGPWQGRARRWTPGWARRRPLPARRHGDANRAPGFKDKAVISDAQQPGGAGRAPCHLTSHYTNALHAARPARPGPRTHDPSLLHRHACGFTASFQAPQQPKSFSLFNPAWKEWGYLWDHQFWGENPQREGKSSLKFHHCVDNGNKK